MEFRERTTKQPIRWRCWNSQCCENGKWFEFTSDQPKCPRCGQQKHPFIAMLSLLHLLVPAPNGPIVSNGKRFKIACDTTNRREHIATLKNNESGTGNPEIVNCPGCRKEIERQRIRHPIGELIG